VKFPTLIQSRKNLKTKNKKGCQPTPEIGNPDEYHPSSTYMYVSPPNYVLGKIKGGKMVIDYLPEEGIIISNHLSI